MQQITELGIDIAKNVFELCGLNAAHEVVYRKRVRRRQFLATVLNLDAKRIYIEACGSSHHWARQLQRENRSVTLLAPHQVKPFNTGNKNDANDALAIAVAGTQAKIRPVAIKSFEQQDIQALHRVREQVKKQRTEVINQARGLLAEYGQVLPVGVSGFRRGVPELLEEADNGLTDRLRALVADLYDHFHALEARMQQYDRDIKALANQIDFCRRAMEVGGIGAQTATAFYATVGDAALFDNGRQVSAWVGLVPKQHSSGDRQWLGSITKRGSRYLRTLLVHGARALLTRVEHLPGRRGDWLRQRVARNGRNKAAVALANKNARILWALMYSGDSYRAA